MKFRTLKPDEIDCRVSTISEKGLTLLLYKDARVDMNLLDETVGCENWQRKHDVVNNSLFCSVGIKCENEWIWKQDVGTESYTEKEKGQASDSFKRACTNWGIGRELYDAPFIWISSNDFELKEKNGKFTTYDKFAVDAIDYDENRKITNLEIINLKTKKLVYKLGQKIEEQKDTTKKNVAKAIENYTGNEKATQIQIDKIFDLVKALNMPMEQQQKEMEFFKKSKYIELTKLEADKYIKNLAKRVEAQNGKSN